MFVVRIENDEATLFRAFRHLASARSWAVEHNASDAQGLFDIFDVPGSLDASAAVAEVRGGRAVLLQRVEAIATPAWIADQYAAGHSPSDHAFA